MKKRLLIFSFALFLSACADQNQYKEAVLAEMQKEQDLKNYKIDPQDMTDCVIDLSSQNMRGLFPFDPARMTAYRNYTTMLTFTQTKDPKATLIQLTKDFGSSKALIEARVNYSESIGNCLASNIIKKEEQEKDENPATPEK